MWLTDDGGESWRKGNQGLRPRYLPEDTPEDEVGLCVHRLRRHPRQPERIFMQFHGGVYRSDDAGESWSDIAPGLPASGIASVPKIHAPPCIHTNAAPARGSPR